MVFIFRRTILKCTACTGLKTFMAINPADRGATTRLIRKTNSGLHLVKKINLIFLQLK
jgi:hypothetical protein